MEPRKKRKPTYLVQKEEREELQTQVQRLQQQLQALQDRADGCQRRKLYASVGLNLALKKTVEQQHMHVASAQSLMSDWMQHQSDNPMGMHIHLGREWSARRKTLLAMKDERIARGFRYTMARCEHLSLLKPQFTEEAFEDENGDFCCIRNEVIPFPGVQSLKKVFDGVRFAIDTLEISVSEHLGHVTLRDDYDTIEAGAFISNYRLSSGLDCGITTEQNAVAFGQYVDSTANGGKHPYAIMTIDSVDQDDLHPYHPSKCARKMLNGTVLLLPVTRKKRKDEQDEDEVVIVALRTFFSRMCPPEFEISELAAQELRDNTTSWGNVVLRAIRQYVYGPPSTG